MYGMHFNLNVYSLYQMCKNVNKLSKCILEIHKYMWSTHYCHYPTINVSLIQQQQFHRDAFMCVCVHVCVCVWGPVRWKTKVCEVHCGCCDLPAAPPAGGGSPPRLLLWVQVWSPRATVLALMPLQTICELILVCRRLRLLVLCARDAVWRWELCVGVPVVWRGDRLSFRPGWSQLR